MAIIKDLGRVKGEDGDIYLPQIKEVNGEIVFSWRKISHTEADEVNLEDYALQFPMYVPEMNGTNLSFRLTKPTKNVDGTYLQSVISCGNIKGDRGPEGIVRLNIEHINPEIEDITDATVERKIDTLYVHRNQVWIYDPNALDPENPFVLIEGMDLSGYALVENVYSKTDIDTMFNGVTQQIEKIAQLFDVNTS